MLSTRTELLRSLVPEAEVRQEAFVKQFKQGMNGEIQERALTIGSKDREFAA